MIGQTAFEQIYPVRFYRTLFTESGKKGERVAVQVNMTVLLAGSVDDGYILQASRFSQITEQGIEGGEVHHTAPRLRGFVYSCPDPEPVSDCS